MKQPKLAARILAGVMAGLLAFGVIAIALVYILA